MEHITRVSERNNIFLDPLKRTAPASAVPPVVPSSSVLRRLSFRKPVQAGDPSTPLVIGSHNWSDITGDNRIEVLIDGLETFERYYDVIMGARHSLCILGWEFCLDFGLILATRTRGSLPVTYVAHLLLSYFCEN